MICKWLNEVCLKLKLGEADNFVSLPMLKM